MVIDMSIDAAIKGALAHGRQKKIERLTNELIEIIKNLENGQLMKEDFPEETRQLLKNLL